MAYNYNQFQNQFQSPYGFQPGQQFPGMSLYYAPGGSGQHNWAFSPDMVAPMMRGQPTARVQAQAFRMSDEPFMMPRAGGGGVSREIGSAYTPSPSMYSSPTPNPTQPQRRNIRRR